jgi:PAS domain S-box-containing protein
MTQTDTGRSIIKAAVCGAVSALFVFGFFFLVGSKLPLIEIVSVNDGYGIPQLVAFPVNRLLTFSVLTLFLGVIALIVEQLFLSKSQQNKPSLYKELLDKMEKNIPGVVLRFRVKNSVLHSVDYCSSKLEAYYGIAAEHLVKDFSALKLFDEDKSNFHQRLFKAAEKMEPFFFEGRILINESELKWFRLEANPTKDENGDVLYTGVMIDITAQKETEEEILFVNENAQALSQQLFEVNQILQNKNVHLQQLNKLKSEFLGMAAHDLKNPLNGVAGMAEILNLTISEDPELSDTQKEEYQSTIDDIRSSADHMLKIITDTLNAESLEHGSLVLDQKEQDLNKIMEHVVHLNMHHAKEKGISIKYTTTGAIKAVVDSSKIREVMDNLVNNAVKYSPQNSQIFVNLGIEAGDHAVFSVKDQGPGLSAGDQQKLFGRFQKLSAKPTGGESSTGLGLSIVKTIVELHKGSIWCESELGKGATFIVDVPLHALAENDSEEIESYVETTENP